MTNKVKDRIAFPLNLEPTTKCSQRKKAGIQIRNVHLFAKQAHVSYTPRFGFSSENLLFAFRRVHASNWEQRRIRYPYAYARVVGLIVPTTTSTTKRAHNNCFYRGKSCLCLSTYLLYLASLKLLLGGPTIYICTCTQTQKQTQTASVSSLFSLGFSNAELQTGPSLAKTLIRVSFTLRLPMVKYN